MNVYLLVSDSRYLIRDKINELVDEDSIINKFDLEEDSLDDIIEDSSYEMLFNEKKVNIIYNSNIFNTKKLSDNEYDRFIKFINNTSVELIFITQSVDERKKITKYFKDNCNFFELKINNDSELNKIVINKFKEDGYNIDYNCVLYIITQCLSNYDLIINEIEKIKIFYGVNKDIRLDDLRDLVSKNIENDFFKFTNAVIRKDYKRIYELYEDLLTIKFEPMILITILSNQYRNIFKAKYYLNKKYSVKDIVNKLGIKKYPAELAIQNSYNYTSQELMDKLYQLSELDLMIKNSKVDKYIGFNNFILNI